LHSVSFLSDKATLLELLTGSTQAFIVAPNVSGLELFVGDFDFTGLAGNAFEVKLEGFFVVGKDSHFFTLTALKFLVLLNSAPRSLVCSF
jgi:hypothetical protein